MAKNSEKERPAARILLVEDEETLGAGLEYNLAEEGYQVIWARDGREGLRQLEKGEFDLVILDIMLPYLDGYELASRIRQKSAQLPILMLTAKKTPQDRIKGLQLGADDYLTKPFHLPELLLRIKGMLKRKEWYQPSAIVYRFGDNEINFSNLSCRAGEHRFQLTPHEAMVLKYLIEHRGKIVSRSELLKNVWQLDAGLETRTVDNFIVRLRKYFEPDPARPRYIKSVRGAGYLFED